MQNKYIRTSLIAVFLLVYSFCGIAAIFPKKDVVKNESEVGIKLSPEDQRKFDYYFYEAMNAKAVDRFDDYFDYLSFSHELDSTNAAILYELGNIYNSIDQKSKALGYLKDAVKYDKNNFYYNALLGALLLELQQYSEAVDVYEYLLSQDPSKFELYLYLSESYRLLGNLPKAIEALDNVEKVVGLNEKISLQKFQLYSVLDKKEKAYAEFQKYIDKYPKDVKYYVFLGNLYMQDNKAQDAYIIYSKAKAIDPEDPYLITAMAAYYEKMNNKQAAEKELNAALLSPKLDIDSKLGILAQYVGTLQQNEGDTQRANVLLDTLMLEHPQEPKLNLMYGNLLMIQKKTDEARFQFQVFAESNPTNPLGWEQMLKSIPPDSLDLSISVCETAISYIPDEPLFFYFLGVNQYQKEEHDLALATLKKGVALIGEDDNPALGSEFYGLIGNLYFETNQKDSAFVAFEKALEYNPRNLLILNNYSYFLSVENRDLDRAEKMSTITIKAEPTNPTFLDTYGWIMFMQGDYVTSRIYLENAVKYSEEKEKEISAEVLEHYGDVLFKVGEEEEALQYWIRAKETGKSESKTLDEKIKSKKYMSEF